MSTGNYNDCNAELDDFWKIACLYDSEYPQNESVVLDNSDHASDDESIGNNDSSKLLSNVLYQLNIAPYGKVDLNLTPIVSTSSSSTTTATMMNMQNSNDTVTHILGANVWFGSAILSALFQQLTMSMNTTSSKDNVIQSYLNQLFLNDNNNTTINVLELGSGAVGLTGIVVGLCISGYIEMIKLQNQNDSHCYTTNKNTKKCRMILTDHDPTVLQQLQYNIQSTRLQLQNQFPSKTILPEYIVQNLDWNDDTFVLNTNLDTSSSCNGTSNCYRYRKNNEQQHLHLVVGSELVYNTETADACIHIVLQLLQKHLTVLIVLVQMTDRDGWNTIFIPTLLKYQQELSSTSPKSRIHFEMESSIIQPDIYDLACKLVSPGGTLNPLSDYTICYIWNGS